MEHDNLFDLFERTLNNCHYYEDESQMHRLYSEIGCLRGIFYCIENLNLVDYIDCTLFNEFQDFVSEYLEDLDNE